MRFFREPEEHSWGADLASLTLGAIGGLALGALLSRRLPSRNVVPARPLDQSRSGSVPPPRYARTALPPELERLESAVVDAFLADPELSNRGIDVEVLATGIVELSGRVRTEDEAARAVALTNAVEDVRTVVNRLDVEDSRRSTSTRDGWSEPSPTFGHSEGRVGGMGRRRQGGTDPDRRDDSQAMRQDALAAADRVQWVDEDLASDFPRTSERPEVQSPNRTRYTENELDNQDPHGKHAPVTLDAQPRDLNTAARVGEGPKPGAAVDLTKDRGEGNR